MKYFILICLLSSLSAHVQAQSISKCKAAPHTIVIIQPDGSSLTIAGKGNIEISYTETTDGYTIIKNNNGIYEYAVQNNRGDLVPSGIKANDVDNRMLSEIQFINGLQKNIRYSTEKIKEIQQSNINGRSGPADNDSIKETFPTTGNRKVLMLLIQYPDLPNTYPNTDLSNLMNQTNFNGTGSFKDYYLQNSFNQLDLTVDVFGWYTAYNNYEYYGRQNGYEVARELAGEAVDAAEAAGVDFSQYDNDNDGYVDGVILVHSGPGAEEGSQLQYVWSHRWSLGSQSRYYDGVEIYDYMMNPETRSYGMVGIGVFCHEFGHGLGLPDLYDTDVSNGDSEGIGRWGVMGSGGWLNNEKTPAQFCAWSKIDRGWQVPTEITAAGTYTLNSSDSENKTYRISTQYSNEYFLLENRQQTGFDSYLPGNGLAIWHINTDKADLYSGFGSNAVNADEDYKGIDLEEADSYNDLDNEVNRGDAGDLFPGSANKITFNDNTYPNANTDFGDYTGISVYDITNSGGVVTYTIGTGCIPPATPGSISGAAQTCRSQTGITYSINAISGATYYTWTVPSGASITANNGTSIVVNFGTSSGNICVTASNNCGTSASTCKYISVIGPPQAPSDIKGPDYTCINSSNVVYTVNSVSGATYYSWTVPQGSTIVSGQGTTSITLKPGASSGDVCATAGNSCGSNTRCESLIVSCVGMEDIAKNADFITYPNPHAGKMNIQFTKKDKNPAYVSIINLLGEKIMELRIDESGLIEKQIDFYSHAKGVYIIQVKQAQEILQRKVVYQ